MHPGYLTAQMRGHPALVAAGCRLNIAWAVYRDRHPDRGPDWTIARSPEGDALLSAGRAYRSAIAQLEDELGWTPGPWQGGPE